MARVYGDFYHARGVTAELRDLALAGRTPQQSYDGIAWLYGGPERMIPKSGNRFSDKIMRNEKAPTFSECRPSR